MLYAFDGLKRTCVAYKLHGGKQGHARCAKFRKGAGKPNCTALVDGGRSKGLIRAPGTRCPVRRHTKGSRK